MDRIGITLGDPAGIGPEIVAKSLSGGKVDPSLVVLFGSFGNFTTVVDSLKLDKRMISKAEFVDIGGNGIPAGRVSEASGAIALRSIEIAVKNAMEGKVSGICTAPINKESILRAGSKYIDHTDMLAGLTSSSDVVTLFETGTLRLIFLSKHVSLRNALDLVRKENIVKHIMLADRALKCLGAASRRIAVAALNPHGGENGLFGDEEIREIIPAVAEASGRFDVSGPFPADSVFAQAARGRFDIVLSMYHDQGHIAAKMLDFEKTVSMNLGLPFLRTSVDHGNAFDIAGKGVADETSMTEAMLKCLKYSRIYRDNMSGLTG